MHVPFREERHVRINAKINCDKIILLIYSSFADVKCLRHAHDNYSFSNAVKMLT